jgi:hypothetical protein
MERCRDTQRGNSVRDDGSPRATLAAMPTVPNILGPFRLFFYSFDCREPAHVHARRDRATCKFWLDPVRLAANHGLTPRELAGVRRIIILNRDRILEAWREHCGATE